MAHIDEIGTLIDNHINDTGDEQMSEDAFDYYIQKELESDEMNLVGGYYLASTSSHTSELYKVYPEVVTESLSMQEGEYSRVETDFGVCFIYKDEIEVGAYMYSDYSQFFDDFYSDAADYIFTNELEGYYDDVKVKDKFYEIDLIEIPYNYNLIAYFD